MSARDVQTEFDFDDFETEVTREDEDALIETIADSISRPATRSTTTFSTACSPPTPARTFLSPSTHRIASIPNRSHKIGLSNRC